MNISQVSKDFLDLFSENTNNIQKTNISNKNKQKFIEFYNLLNKFELKVQNNNSRIQHNSILNRIKIINKFDFLNKDNIFLSKRIQTSIIQQMTSLKTFSVKINNIIFTINIFFMNNDKKNVIIMKKNIIRLLYFLSNFIINNKIKTVNINIVLLDLKKELPMNNSVLNSYNINTGVTWACHPNGEIVIYRKEEWFKVLIHELFHSLCFDFANLNMTKILKDKITKLFFIKHSNFEISETYSEFWANIINSVLISYEFTSNFKDFLEQFEMFHTIEKYFSIFQTIKILNYMNLNYNIITSKKKTNKEMSIINYREQTNVFAYFIMKMVLLFHMNDMLIFFSNNHDSNIINCNKDYGYVYKLIEKTTKLYKKKALLSAIKKYSSIYSQLNIGLPNQLSLNVNLMQSLRMSIIEYEN